MAKTRKNHAFKVVDSVLISTKSLSMESGSGKHKIQSKFCGRSPSLQMVTDVTARLDLSAPKVAEAIHDAFLVSFLKPYAKDTFERCPEELPPTRCKDENEEYKVGKILNHRKIYGKLQYLIK